MIKPKLVFLLFSLTVLTILTGCMAVRHLVINTVSQSNNAFPVAVDVVFVYQDELIPTVSEMNGLQWFEAKSQLELRHQNDIDVISFELVPGVEEQVVQLPQSVKKAKKALIFANYNYKLGHGSFDITGMKNISILLAKDSFTVSGIDN